MYLFIISMLVYSKNMKSTGSCENGATTAVPRAILTIDLALLLSNHVMLLRFASAQVVFRPPLSSLESSCRSSASRRSSLKSYLFG